MAPLLYPSPKTHKSVDEKGDPRSRPIVQANSCLTSRPAEILADVLEAAIQALPVQTESRSTEDMLAKVDRANESIRASGVDVCVGSGDAVSLYPSLQHQQSAHLCKQLVVDSPASFTNVNIQAAAVFVATHCSQTEIQEAGLSKVVPRTKHCRGKMPTTGTDELTKRNQDSNDPRYHKFMPVRDNLTEAETRLLIATVIRVGVLSVVRNHIYQWKGQLWIQKLGVPTGLRLSGIIGQITMDHWRSTVNKMMIKNSMVGFLLEKYVDDCEVICENLEPGTRWDGQRLCVTPEAAEEDCLSEKPKDQITMDAWGQMASSIVPGLIFTTDCCSKNPSGTVPMLDFQMWKVREADPLNPGATREAMRYSFYEKYMSNNKVMDNKSAMPRRTKVASLTLEVVRRLCNTSREVDDKDKGEILSKFMRKLQLSGYSLKVRADILAAGVKTYRRKELAERLKVQPIHRLGTHDHEARRREKISGKASWYKPQSTGWKSRLAAKEQEQMPAGGQQSWHTPCCLLPAPPSHTSTSTIPEKVHTMKPSNNKSRSITNNILEVPQGPNTIKVAVEQEQRPAGGQQGSPLHTPCCLLHAPPTPTKIVPPWSRIEAVMFVPHTPEGGLAQALQAAKDEFARLHSVARVKIIERGGCKVKDILGKKDPWASTGCGRQDCMVCLSKGRKQDTPTTCSQENICYEISCDMCLDMGVAAKYYGESARTPYLRGREHLQGQARQHEDNPLMKHDQLHHHGVHSSYSMKVLRKHKAPLARQVQEATEIDHSNAQIILNSKGEFNGARIPRITLEMGGKVRYSDYAGQQQQEESREDTEGASVAVRSWEKEVRRQGRQMVSTTTTNATTTTITSKTKRSGNNNDISPNPKKARTQIKLTDYYSTTTATATTPGSQPARPTTTCTLTTPTTTTAPTALMTTTVPLPTTPPQHITNTAPTSLTTPTSPTTTPATPPPSPTNPSSPTSPITPTVITTTTIKVTHPHSTTSPTSPTKPMSPTTTTTPATTPITPTCTTHTTHTTVPSTPIPTTPTPNPTTPTKVLTTQSPHNNPTTGSNNHSPTSKGPTTTRPSSTTTVPTTTTTTARTVQFSSTDIRYRKPEDVNVVLMAGARTRSRELAKVKVQKTKTQMQKSKAKEQQKPRSRPTVSNLGGSCDSMVRNTERAKAEGLTRVGRTQGGAKDLRYIMRD